MEIQENKLIELNGEIEFFQDDKWLSNACKRYCINGEPIEKIPTNIILDKTLTGIGVTTWELKAHRHSIIIEPNVPVIIDKTSKDMLPVYEGVTPPKIKEYLENTNIKYKKILTTPEGFWKIIEAGRESNIDIKAKYFCLFDECEKITQDINYRNRIIAPLNEFLQFDGKAFVSATPLSINPFALRNESFRKVKVKPMFDYRKELTLIPTNSFDFKVKERLEALQHSKCACVFYNSISGIKDIIASLGIKGQSKIFCSKDSYKKLIPDGYNTTFKISLPLAKYNFFTSSFFSALDIDIREKADVLILSKWGKANHSIIDPFTEAIQIQGRFRHVFKDGTTFKSLTHITDLIPKYKAKTPDQIKVEIEAHKKIFFELRDKRDKLKDTIEKEENLIQKASLQSEYDSYTDNLKKLSVNAFLDKDRKWSFFLEDNYFNEQRTINYYTAEEALVNAYVETNHFDVSHESDVVALRLITKDTPNTTSRKTPKSFMKGLVPMLNGLSTEELRKERKERLKYTDKDFVAVVDFIFEVYEKLGASVFEKHDYNQKRIQRELDKHNDEEKRFSIDVLGEILQTMNKLPKNEKNHIAKTAIQSALMDIYKRYGITKKVSQDTIIDYYGKDGLHENNKKPYSFELMRMKPEYANLVELCLSTHEE